MKTNLTNDFLQTPEGEEANRILRSCVHCGFCNATCPTYQLLGNELDGPRGRIYLIKQTLEGKTPGKQTQLHLDRCLTCRNCETTCPSGVNYIQLLNIGRSVVNKQVPRSIYQKLLHFTLRKLFLSHFSFSLILNTAQLLKPVLPANVKSSIPSRQKRIDFKSTSHKRKVLLVPGCVQSSLKPDIDTAAKIVFNKLNIECITIPSAGCCGSLSHHLNAENEAINIIKTNIDSWWPLVKNNTIEAICMTASGCGVAIKEYEQLLANDKDYADKAKKVSALYKDPAEIVSAEINHGATKGTDLRSVPNAKIIAFHPPCTLQHGMKLNNLIEPVLSACGYSLQSFNDKHLCCGSAGTYSITQKKISQQLLSNKLSNINKTDPDIIVTANIGCQLHLQSGTNTPVKHWLELLT
ncbi:MAG: glycolate oxidase subunit GlcF [Gammaproteobacteria bacterium]|nr:glycolate oxidase subunit GlcF [Gammaproteobacteria bacterium]